MHVLVLFTIPMFVLVVVLLLGFVGCELPTQGTGPTPIPYQDLIVGTLGLIRYWPLADSPVPDPPGTNYVAFIEPTQMGAQVGWHTDDPRPSSSNPSGPSGFETTSAEASGAITLGAAGLLDTDTATSMSFDGGYVEFNPEPALNPPPTPGFTIEAWVYPEWDGAEIGVDRVVVSSFDTSTGGCGFILLKNSDNHWAVRIGTGDDSGPWFAAGDSITPHLTYHLLATYDGNTNTLALYVDGAPSGENTPPSPYAPNLGGIFGGFYIGAAPGFGGSDPIYPFKGRIQAVAIYNRPLIWPDEVQARWWAANYLG
jgi:Concanavalin A-like lectin/glucanases superfamily